MKKIKDNINRQKDKPCSWIRRINIVKMTILRKASYSFNTTATKLPMAFPQNLNKKNLKIYITETQKTLNEQSNLGKEKWS